MIKSYSETEITFEKELNKLDQFVLDFIKLLGNINYVLVSGYVAIFFGRSRATEDIDFFIEKLTFEEFKLFAKRVTEKGYWFVNGNDVENLYAILKEGSSLRIAKKGEWDPNAEIKFPMDNTDFFSLKNKIKVVFGDNVIYISPIELQIAYKLKLAHNIKNRSSKDIEDALHIFKLFEKYLSKEELIYSIRLLKAEVPEWLENYLKK